MPPLGALSRAHSAPEEVELKAQRSDAKDGLSEPAFMNWLLGGKNQSLEKSALAAGVFDLVKSGYAVFDKRRNGCVPFVMETLQFSPEPVMA